MWGSKGIAHVNTEVSGQLNAPAALTLENSLRYPFERRLRGDKEPVLHFRGVRCLLPLPGIEPHTLVSAASSVVFEVSHPRCVLFNINITMYELVRTQLYLNMVHGVVFTINYMFRPLYWPSSGLHYA